MMAGPEKALRPASTWSPRCSNVGVARDCVSVREKRERERQRQSDRQTGRDRDRDRDRETERDRERERCGRG